MRHSQAIRLLLLAVLCPLLMAGSSGRRPDLGAGHSEGVTWRVSLGSGGQELDGDTNQPSLSADNRYVVFWSRATNLHPADPGPKPDVFRRDLQTGEVELVSVNLSGISGNFSSYSPTVSGDGHTVAFASWADDLIPDDQNEVEDVYLRDLDAGTTFRISQNEAGQGGNHHSLLPSISADGRFVAFTSYASNLTADDTNHYVDIFIYGVETGKLELVSRGYTGQPANGNSGGKIGISSDGRFLLFPSGADNLVPDDHNGMWDLFWLDRLTGEMRLMTRSPDGAQSNSETLWGHALSADGRWVAFSSPADNLVPDDNAGWIDVFLHNLETGELTRISRSFEGGETNGRSTYPVLSGDGRFLSYMSNANNVVPGDDNGREDVFIYDRLTGETRLVSLSSFGVQGNGWSDIPALSQDGRLVAFLSAADNLVPGDMNGAQDVFLHDRFLTERIYFPLVWPASP